MDLAGYIPHSALFYSHLIKNSFLHIIAESMVLENGLQTGKRQFKKEDTREGWNDNEGLILTLTYTINTYLNLYHSFPKNSITNSYYLG